MAEGSGTPARQMAEGGGTPAHRTSVLEVHLVEPEREVWAGEATYVIARSAGGDLGVLPGHEPVLSLLGIGPVKIERQGQSALIAAVDGGFLSVSNIAGVTRVDVLAEHVTLKEDISNSEVTALDKRAEDLLAAGDPEAATAESAKADVRRRLNG